MGKTTQVMKLCAEGRKFTVQLRNGEYRLYIHWYGYNEYGYLTEHKQMILRRNCLGDILSGLHYYFPNSKE